MRALLYALCVAAPWALLSGSPATATTVTATLLVALLLAVASTRAVPVPVSTRPAGSAAATRAAPPRLPQHDADAAGHPRPRAPGTGPAVRPS